MNKIPTRSEVGEDQKWNVAAIFKTEEDYEKSLEDLQKLSGEFVGKYKGKLKSAEIIEKSLPDFEALTTVMNALEYYASLNVSVDITDSKNQIRISEFSVIHANITSSLLFYNVELADADKDVLEKVQGKNPQYADFIGEILRGKPYTLSAAEEELLAALAPALELPYNNYNQSKQADMSFDDFEIDSVVYPMSFVNYENVYSHSSDQRVRHAAFKSFSAGLKKYKNTIASDYNAQVQKEKIIATRRGFESVFDYLLFNQKVSRELYDRQIDTIMEELSPIMRSYVAHVADKRGLKQIHFADLKQPLMGDATIKVSKEQVNDYIRGAIGVMGSEYLDQVMKYEDERWVDFAVNKGKSTGGFCASPYKIQPFILLSWSGLLSDMYTLIHELGHAINFKYIHSEHSILTPDPSLYMIEAASTIHEMLLTNYMLSQDISAEMKLGVLASMIENTYYHNFVTHLLEAHYQREVYKLVDKGQSLNAEILTQLKMATLKEFWKDSVVIDEDAALTWMRQPHYYMGLYPYTYSAGLTVGTIAAQKIAQGDPEQIAKWIDYLKTSGLNPIDAAKVAGVDISTDKALKDTIAYIGSIVDEIKTL